MSSDDARIKISRVIIQKQRLLASNVTNNTIFVKSLLVAIFISSLILFVFWLAKNYLVELRIGRIGKFINTTNK